MNLINISDIAETPYIDFEFSNKYRIIKTVVRDNDFNLNDTLSLYEYPLQVYEKVKVLEIMIDILSFSEKAFDISKYIIEEYSNINNVENLFLSITSDSIAIYTKINKNYKNILVNDAGLIEYLFIPTDKNKIINIKNLDFKESYKLL